MKPLYTSVTMKKLTASWDKYFLMILKKKAWHVYTNALHREKLCNHCIQLWQQTETSCHKRIYGTNIFWWSTKKAWQVYTMHYIGKSYATTVHKLDHGFLWQKLSRSLRFPSHFWSYAVIGCWGVLVVSLLYGSWLHTGDKPYETCGFIHF